jgi:hypothetical protein
MAAVQLPSRLLTWLLGYARLSALMTTPIKDAEVVPAGPGARGQPPTKRKGQHQRDRGQAEHGERRHDVNRHRHREPVMLKSLPRIPTVATLTCLRTLFGGSSCENSTGGDSC